MLEIDEFTEIFSSSNKSIFFAVLAEILSEI
jgi:hypothetical protein